MVPISRKLFFFGGGGEREPLSEVDGEGSGPKRFRFHFSKFLSSLGPFLSFHVFKVTILSFVPSRAKNGASVSPLGCKQLDDMSTLGSNFQCCTALGKNLSVGPRHFD